MTSGSIARIAALAMIGVTMGGGIVALQTSSARAEESESATHAKGVPLDSVKKPMAVLTNAKIMDRSGASVGTVSEVILDAKGKPIELKVDVGSYLGMTYKLVSMKASDFTFDRAHKTLVTSLTKNQIHVIAGG